MSKLIPRPKIDDFPLGLARLDKFALAERDYYKAVAERAIEALTLITDNRVTEGWMEEYMRINGYALQALADIEASQGDV